MSIYTFLDKTDILAETYPDSLANYLDSIAGRVRWYWDNPLPLILVGLIIVLVLAILITDKRIFKHWRCKHGQRSG